jgi:hypothetical protein
MNAPANTPATVMPKIIAHILLPILMLVALYYLYKFLFSSNGMEGKTLINGIRIANPEVGNPYITLSNEMPYIYEGGEYTINGWVYINDYSVRRTYNKPIFTIGGQGCLTMAAFLGPVKNTLHIRVTTDTQTSPLKSTNWENLFGKAQTGSDLLSASQPCDIDTIEMQKWVQVTIVLNNKICDVYIDGKLARSCILPSFFKVDRNNLTFRVSEYGGFGGYVSNISAYNYALNPEQIWRLYMSGPGPQYGLLDYLKSLFDPKALGSLDFPKMNTAQ